MWDVDLDEMEICETTKKLVDIQAEYRRLLMNGHIQEMADLKKILNIKPEFPSVQIQNTYASLLTHGHVYDIVLLEKTTDIKPIIPFHILQEKCYSLREHGFIADANELIRYMTNPAYS